MAFGRTNSSGSRAQKQKSAAVRTHRACPEDSVFVLKVMRTWLNSHFAKIVPARKEQVAGEGWGAGGELVDRLLGTLGRGCWWLDQEGSTSCGVGWRQGDETRTGLGTIWHSAV